ncbi:MAG: site-specific integrase [Actinomycetota bacterium]|nr:site-specific integrase [Actinomycetota bacterium]
MQGSIRQRGHDTWQLRVYTGVDAHSGRERWASRTVHGSRRYARAELEHLKTEVGYARIHAGTVGQLLERWFRAASAHWSASTVRQTRSIIDCHLIPRLGHLAVTKLTTVDIDDFYSDLLRAGGNGGRSLAPGTVQRVHVVLHRALAQAVLWNWIWLNPATNTTPPRCQPSDIRPPSVTQVADLLAQVARTDPALLTYMRLAALTGARRSQLLALRWSEVDIARSALSFTRALVEGPRGPCLQPTKTRRSYRVSLDADSRQLLADHGRAVVARARTAKTEITGDSFVFSFDAAGRRPWSPNWVTKQFIAARRRAQLPHFRLHDLRHFMATQMLNAGVPIVTVSQRLSHARASTTLNVYAHAVPGGDHDAAETLSTMLDEVRAPFDEGVCFGDDDDGTGVNGT